MPAQPEHALLGEKRAFQVHDADDVATLLEDSGAETVKIIGNSYASTITLTGPARMAHKVALRRIGEGRPIHKFGVIIGIATRDIAPGEWVHLHNCRSQVDARSSTLDLQTGASTDIAYE